MSLFEELNHEQHGTSACRLHVASQTRESAPLLRSPSLKARTCVGTSLRHREVVA
jgi:hypothetical protein